ncbi:MAG TPA: 3-deoxy-7-phosphoheptulonate synthase [Planctomycetota bacterium]|nr:3-deoxy-7-phosphoheptulonate synthase [Planctomycetota bacterium]
MPLISPRTVKEKLPLPASVRDLVLDTRHAICDIIHGRDRHRVLVVVGPCSIHDIDAAVDYATRLKKVADATREHLVLVMRTYFEKPRTTVGWKGLINDPRLDGSCDIGTGLEIARKLMLKINGMGVPCASELLDPVTPQYIADLVSWAAIGARTTESQTHREMASGLSMPVGFKNGTDGSLEVALNAMISARHPHSFLGINAEGVTSVIKTCGNPDRHIVLRGGGGKTNYGPEDIHRAAKVVADEGLVRPVMVDCSHGNADKDHNKQVLACRAVTKELEKCRDHLMGLMIESNLKPGKQSWKQGAKLEYGVSITDACIGWEDTEKLLTELAEQIAKSPAAA